MICEEDKRRRREGEEYFRKVWGEKERLDGIL